MALSAALVAACVALNQQQLGLRFVAAVVV